MSGVELYIRDANNYYCYKQSHNGYYITDYIDEKKDDIFNMTAEEIIREFHNKFFVNYLEGNYHDVGTPLEYGIKIPKEFVDEDKEFCDIYNDIDQFINNYYSVENEDLSYDNDYSDYIVYIDLVDQRIEGIDSDEDDSSGNDLYIDYDCGCNKKNQ